MSTSHDEPAVIAGQLDIYDQLNDEAGEAPMPALNADAREWLKAMEITEEEWAQHHFHENEWGGDACGCMDDRCIGYHHYPSESCGCFKAHLDEYMDKRDADREAAPIWQNYSESLEEGDEKGVRLAREDAAAWVRSNHPTTHSWSLDEVVEGQAGISIVSGQNDQRRLVWAAPK